MTDRAQIIIHIIHGMSTEQLRDQLAHWPRHQGLPIVPITHDVRIVELPPQRVEPDIEDEA